MPFRNFDYGNNSNSGHRPATIPIATHTYILKQVYGILT